MFNHLSETLIDLQEGPMSVARDPFADAVADRIPELISTSPPKEVTAMVLGAMGLSAGPAAEAQPTAEAS